MSLFQSVGDICQASEADLADMGTIGYAMSTDDISCLENLLEDAMAELGSLSMWKSEKVCASQVYSECNIG